MGFLELFSGVQDFAISATMGASEKRCDKYTGARSSSTLPSSQKTLPVQKVVPTKVASTTQENTKNDNNNNIADVFKNMSDKEIFDVIYVTMVEANASQKVANAVGNLVAGITLAIRNQKIDAKDINIDDIGAMRKLCKQFSFSDADILDMVEFFMSVNNIDAFKQSIVSNIKGDKKEEQLVKPLTMDFSQFIQNASPSPSIGW